LKNIISASRRTDIPAFYSAWLINRLKQEEVYVRNPYGGQVRRVSLRADDIHSIVFWSKNFSPLISRIGEIERAAKNLFFHFTITGIPEEIEQNIPPFQEAIDDFKYLSDRYSPEHMIWRFDPVCLTDKLSFEFYEEMFMRCGEKLKGSCVKCYISFVQKYKKTLTNFNKYSNHKLVDIETGTHKEYAGRLGRIAEKNGIRLYACCNDHLLSDTVHKGSCINSRELTELFNDYSVSSPAAPTRKECACTKSIDIGSYDTCPHGCLYCYANADKLKARTAFEKMDMNWNALGFNVAGEEVVDTLQENAPVLQRGLFEK
jgi:hypothetical protein